MGIITELVQLGKTIDDWGVSLGKKNQNGKKGNGVKRKSTSGENSKSRAVVEAVVYGPQLPGLASCYSSPKAEDFESMTDGDKVEAIENARKKKDSKAIPFLVEGLKDSNSDVRKAAAWALGKIGDSSAIPALKAALKDSDSDVKKAAMEALGKGEHRCRGIFQEIFLSGP